MYFQNLGFELTFETDMEFLATLKKLFTVVRVSMLVIYPEFFMLKLHLTLSSHGIGLILICYVFAYHHLTKKIHTHSNKKKQQTWHNISIKICIFVYSLCINCRYNSLSPLTLVSGLVIWAAVDPLNFMGIYWCNSTLLIFVAAVNHIAALLLLLHILYAYQQHVTSIT
jgi:hypothetical protein